MLSRQALKCGEESGYQHKRTPLYFRGILRTIRMFGKIQQEKNFTQTRCWIIQWINIAVKVIVVAAKRRTNNDANNYSIQKD